MTAEKANAHADPQHRGRTTGKSNVTETIAKNRVDVKAAAENEAGKTEEENVQEAIEKKISDLIQLHEENYKKECYSYRRKENYEKRLQKEEDAAKKSRT